ncbi:MAG TPA: hypothetical protein VGZ71_15495 [Puia sp.]|nr:hypothetical protein [Puia sp.]
MNNQQRIIITRIAVGYLLIFLFLRFIEHVTPSGWMGPPLFNPQMDLTYWVFKLLGLPTLMVYNRTGAIVFDFLLFASGILSLLFPLQVKFIIPFSILLFVYVVAFNGFGMHHGHALTGMMIVLFPFWARDNSKFHLLWQGIRYYTCYVYGLSFIWKILPGNSFFNWQQGVGTFKINLVEYMYHNPHNILTAFYRWCVREDWILNAGNIFVIILEGLMMIGFFTKKWDKTLFWLPVMIHLATYFFSDVLFFELLVLDFSLLGLEQIDTIGKKFTFLKYSRKPASS